MALEQTNWPAVVAQYEEIGSIIERAAARLKPPGLMAEFELLPPMTEHPSWGAELTSVLLKHLDQLHKDTGIPCALRVTPTDIRDVTKPPELRSGNHSNSCCNPSNSAQRQELMCSQSNQ